jgi:hypothetical protein
MLRGYSINYMPLSVPAPILTNTTVETQLPVTSMQQIDINILTVDSINTIFGALGVYRYRVEISATFVDLQSDIEKTIPLYLEMEVGDINTPENDTCS